MSDSIRSLTALDSLVLSICAFAQADLNNISPLTDSSPLTGAGFHLNQIDADSSIRPALCKSEWSLYYAS